MDWGGEKWPYSGYILKVESIEFADGLNVGSGKKEGVLFLMTEGFWPEQVEGWGCPFLTIRRRAGLVGEGSRSGILFWTC